MTKLNVSSASMEPKTKRERERRHAECRVLHLGDDDPSHPRDGRIRAVPVRDALVGLLPSTHPRDLYDTILLSHGGVEVSSLSSHVGQWIVGSHREREDRSQSMAARYVPKLDAFVQRRLTLRDLELFHLMQTWDEEEEDVLIGR